MSLPTSKLHAQKEEDAPNCNSFENKKFAIHPTMPQYRLVDIVGKFPLGLGIFPYGPSSIQGMAPEKIQEPPLRNG
ncbi:MAG: hypothetical protein A2Z40_01400 [Deltaproteobacteria bacterium RBG_19FT_COMBO_60_16]|nr:MAG: hypothetical protein A2Z40_01400 [Deltaproteobacteria bacterium RBG_19FT_COMBO_60_16]